MALIDTTNVIDSSMFLKAKLKNNKVGQNYYIENLQEKRNADWEMRYNVVEIEEESGRQIDYSPQLPGYLPLEVVIRNVKNDKGQDLGMDWADLSFKDLYYPNDIGYRYRFQLGYFGMKDLKTMTEEEKHYETSIWLTINKSPINPGNSCIVRRCNTNVALVGSPTRSYHNITEARYEPGILETDLRYMNMYYNQTLVIPQAEWYLTMQMNYFTNCIKINQRLMLGGSDVNDLENNSVFKVKAVVKSTSVKTYMKPNSTGIEDIPLVILALDKDLANDNDDFINRIPVEAPIYFVPKQEVIPVNEYYITIGDEEETVQKIMVGNTETYVPVLMLNGEKKDSGSGFTYEVKLNGIKEENWKNYFEFIQNDDGSFSIKNLKTCNRGNLEVTIKSDVPVKTREGKDEQVVNTFKFKLGGFY